MLTEREFSSGSNYIGFGKREPMLFYWVNEKPLMLPTQLLCSGAQCVSMEVDKVRSQRASAGGVVSFTWLLGVSPALGAHCGVSARDRKSCIMCPLSHRFIRVLLPQIFKFWSLQGPNKRDKPFIAARGLLHILTHATSPFTPAVLMQRGIV